MNEMEVGDHVTIVIEEPEQVIKECGVNYSVRENLGYIMECGVSFVYDDEKTDEEDALGYYKSWNHIIGGDLSGFQITTGQYILNTIRFLIPGVIISLDYHPSIDYRARFKESKVWFRAFSPRKSRISGYAREHKVGDN